MGIYNTDKTFRVIDMKVFTNNNLTTFYVDFEENDPKFKSKKCNNIAPNRGRLTLTGIMTN